MTCLNIPSEKNVVNCDGKLYSIVAICTSAGEANVLCGLNPSLSVMGEDGNGRYYLVGSAKPGVAKPYLPPTEIQLEQWASAAELRAGTR